jgi:ParB/RepB/Spo0J family partition protein
MLSQISMSCLIAGKTNPRRVKPERDAHDRLVASIRAHGLIHPLVVRPVGEDGKFAVIAGNRRLAALREVHRNKPDTKVTCVVRKIDADASEAISLGENFVREPMHPLDEAVAFAGLAKHDGKDAVTIAADFGVSEHYVRQRMKLADLAKPIADAYRRCAIDTAVAEVFSSVPQSEQLAIWKSLGGESGAELYRVRQVIGSQWISAKKAIFDVSTLPPEAVTADLFGDDVLIHRDAFIKAQEAAIESKRQSLSEDGWGEVVVTTPEQVRDRLWSMDKPEPIYDDRTTKKLTALSRKAKQLGKKADRMKFNDPRKGAVVEQADAIEGQIEKIISESPATYSDQDKAKATTFVILDPSGSVRVEHRIARKKAEASTNGQPATPDKSLDADTITDSQKGAVYSAHAFAVRQALLPDPHRCKVLLVMALHEHVRSDGLAIKVEPNDSTLHADHNPDLKSAAMVELDARRQKLDPFIGKVGINDITAYTALMKLDDKVLDELATLLVVNLITNRSLKPNGLVVRLASDLKVNLRDHWTPDGPWLKGYRKVQLVDLMTTLVGIPPLAGAKHSQLVPSLAEVFAMAKAGTHGDQKVAERVSRRLPKDVAQEIAQQARGR